MPHRIVVGSALGRVHQNVVAATGIFLSVQQVVFAALGDQPASAVHKIDLAAAAVVDRVTARGRAAQNDIAVAFDDSVSVSNR